VLNETGQITVCSFYLWSYRFPGTGLPLKKRGAFLRNRLSRVLQQHFHQAFLSTRHKTSLTRIQQALVLGPGLYASGGPRLPKMAMVISVPVWQQGQRYSFVVMSTCRGAMFNRFCNAANFARFQVLLSMP
jgi:hypothetical protein